MLTNHNNQVLYFVFYMLFIVYQIYILNDNESKDVIRHLYLLFVLVVLVVLASPVLIIYSFAFWQYFACSVALFHDR